MPLPYKFHKIKTPVYDGSGKSQELKNLQFKHLECVNTFLNSAQTWIKDDLVPDMFMTTHLYGHSENDLNLKRMSIKNSNVYKNNSIREIRIYNLAKQTNKICSLHMEVAAA